MKMKNKKSEQHAARQRHKEEMRTKRRSSPNLVRARGEKDKKPTLLIVCEGKNTEPSYFRQFKLSTATIKAIGEGYNTVSLVNRSIKLSEEDNYDQVWCVFDKDDFSDSDFNEAIRLAERNNFHVAYSNQSFEYWLILHFDDHQGGKMHRNEYNRKINNLLKPFKLRYEGDGGSKLVDENFFELMLSTDTQADKRRIDLAIERAERNLNNFYHFNHAKNESSTTVYLLARELLKHM